MCRENNKQLPINISSKWTLFTLYFRVLKGLSNLKRVCFYSTSLFIFNLWNLSFNNSCWHSNTTSHFTQLGAFLSASVLLVLLGHSLVCLFRYICHERTKRPAETYDRQMGVRIIREFRWIPKGELSYLIFYLILLLRSSDWTLFFVHLRKS